MRRQRDNLLDMCGPEFVDAVRFDRCGLGSVQRTVLVVTEPRAVARGCCDVTQRLRLILLRLFPCLNWIRRSRAGGVDASRVSSANRL